MQTNRKCSKPLPVPETERVCKMSANSLENPPNLQLLGALLLALSVAQSEGSSRQLLYRAGF